MEFYVVMFHLNFNNSSIRSFSKKTHSQKLYIFQLPGTIISILNIGININKKGKQPNLMKITLCVEENKIECKESGSDIKAIYQIPHFDIRKQRKKKSSVERN